VSILDVTNPKEIVSVVDDAFDGFGKIDFAVSNAGYIMVGAAEEAELSRIERLLDTNLLGSIAFAKAVIPSHAQAGRRANPANLKRAESDGLSWHERLCDHEMGY
jgi:NADP-dependent 3-hydroxy acid dehydrogenase YdfG